MFHKTVHKVWNLFKYLEQLPEDPVENSVLWVSIGREFLSINWMFFSINRIAIESSGDSRIIFFNILIDWAKVLTNQKSFNSNFTWKIPELEFSLYEAILSKLKHHYYNLSMYIPIYTTLSSSDICSTTIIIWHLWYSCHNFFYLTFFLHGKLLFVFEICITIIINWILKERVFKGKKMSLFGVLLG